MELERALVTLRLCGRIPQACKVGLAEWGAAAVPVKVGTVCLGQHESRSQPQPGRISKAIIFRPPLAPTLGWAPRRSGARRAGETRVAAPRVAAHTRRCRLRPASPASRAQLIRAALKAQCLGPAEPHAARARCPRAADPGPGRAPWAVRARAPGGQREAGRTARCCGAKSGAAPQRPWRSTSRPFATRTAIWSAATR